MLHRPRAFTVLSHQGLWLCVCRCRTRLHAPSTSGVHSIIAPGSMAVCLSVPGDNSWKKATSCTWLTVCAVAGRTAHPRRSLLAASRPRQPHQARAQQRWDCAKGKTLAGALLALSLALACALSCSAQLCAELSLAPHSNMPPSPRALQAQRKSDARLCSACRRGMRAGMLEHERGLGAQRCHATLPACPGAHVSLIAPRTHAPELEPALCPIRAACFGERVRIGNAGD